MNLTIFRPTETSSPTHPSLLFPQITRCKNVRHLTQIHAHFIKTGLIHDPLAAAEILKSLSLSTHRDLFYARTFFRQIQEPNCFSWNTIIRAFSESHDDDGNDPFEAFLLFCEMCCNGVVKPNNFTLPSVFKACAKAGRVREGKQVHGFAVKLGMENDEFVASNLLRMYVMCGVMEDAHVLFYKRSFEYANAGESVRNEREQEGIAVLWNVMMDGYVRLGDMRTCRKLFDKMTHRSVVSWNVMISGYAQNGYFKEAIEVFHDMLAGDVSPNSVTLVSVLPAISHLGSLELGKWVHLYAEKNKIEVDDLLGSALIDMYSKCGNIEKAIQVFERSSNKKNAVTWSAVIGGLAMHGRARDAVDYFGRMQRSGVVLSDVVYIGLLNACSHAGLVKEGRSCFNHMVNVAGLQPRVEHYGCMVDLLGRAGLLAEAEQLILNMPIEPDDVIWKALLGACKIHGNIEMGERVAKTLMDLFPQDSAAYVALSNMLASVGNWSGFAAVRSRMKELNIRKDPGCSWIEVDGLIQEFVAEDDSHPRAKEIRSMLEEISDQLVLAGYRSNTI